jgi:hypothetical protein
VFLGNGTLGALFVYKICDKQWNIEASGRLFLALVSSILLHFAWLTVWFLFVGFLVRFSYILLLRFRTGVVE